MNVEKLKKSKINPKLLWTTIQNYFMIRITPLYDHFICRKDFIFTFGNIGVGKSTLMSSLAYILFQYFLIYGGNIKNRSGKIMLLDWVERLRNHEFPIRSRIGEILEVDLLFEIKRQTRDLRRIVFLEMSGEDNAGSIDIRRYNESFSNNVDRDLQMESELNNGGFPFHFRFNNYLKFSKIILLITDVLNGSNDDQLIFQFFDYLRNTGIKQPNVGLIITKWDMNKEYQTVEEFVRAKMPQTLLHLESDFLAERRVFPFSVGKVNSNKIEQLNLDYSREIIKWILKILSE